MTNKEQVISIVKDLMEQLYEAKGFNDLKCNPLERNLFETEMQEVWDERRAELALEEDRFFDLIRTGQAANVLGPKGFTSGKNELLPIPANQRQLNPNLVQNPGY